MTSSDAPGKTSRRRAPALPAAALALVALWEVAVAARAGRDTGSADDWAAAAAAVRQGHRPGDLIVFAPGWIDPVGRTALGDLLPVKAAARMDAETYGRIWEVSIRGAAAPAVKGLQPADVRNFGDVRVREFVREPAVALYDFVDRFADATVTGRTSGPARSLVEEVGFSPRRCVRVEPMPTETVTLAYRDVRLGTRLVGYVGLADVFTLRRVREPARLSVLIDGREVAQRVVGVDDGWVRFEAITEPRAAARVSFVATAAAVDRQVCFAAQVRR